MKAILKSMFIVSYFRSAVRHKLSCNGFCRQHTLYKKTYYNPRVFVTSGSGPQREFPLEKSTRVEFISMNNGHDVPFWTNNGSC